jgi:hypothetical protein
MARGATHVLDRQQPDHRVVARQPAGLRRQGRDPNARLVKKAGKGDSTRWSFEKVSSISPKPSRSDDTIQVGPSGMTFRVRAVEGPYKGWYLATKADEEGRLKTLVLVRARKDATVFTYIEKYYYVKP